MDVTTIHTSLHVACRLEHCHDQLEASVLTADYKRVEARVPRSQNTDNRSPNRSSHHTNALLLPKFGLLTYSPIAYAGECVQATTNLGNKADTRVTNRNGKRKLRLKISVVQRQWAKDAATD